MNKEEYLSNIEFLEKKFKKDKRSVECEYAFSSAKFSCGDIVGDCAGRVIRVDALKVISPKTLYNPLDVPVVGYSGRLLTKKLNPRKDMQNYLIVGFNDIKLIKKGEEE